MNDGLFPSAAPDFSDPLGLLRACHQRIAQHCDTLLRLADHLQAQGVDADARKAAGQVYRYFSTAARHHHQDEEQDLFPLLARQSLKLADRVHRLHRDHERMDGLWQALAPQLEKLGSIEDFAAFKAEVEAFGTAYRDHIAFEEEDVLDVAQHILSSDQLKKIGRSMAERRGQQVAFR